MKTTLISWLLVCIAALINAKHFIVETYDEDYDDVVNMMENGEERGNRFLEAGRKPSACFQDPGVRGRGRARHKRWTFTKVAGCYEFNWGGTETNQNKFQNKEDCERKCNRFLEAGRKPSVCFEDPGVTGTGRAGFKRWTFTKAAGCYEFVWGGKATNENKFLNKEDCERNCNNKEAGGKPSACFEDPGVRGRGRARKPRWTFSKAQGCYEFNWGGKTTNQNKFLNKEDCERNCNNKEAGGKPSDCFEDPGVKGNCRARIPKWTFTKDAGCYEFFYGGCSENKNRFDTKDDCEKKCIDKDFGRKSLPSRCLKKPGVRGGCRRRAKRERWTFTKDGVCTKFEWCRRGNGNKFQTEKACTRICMQ